MSEELVQKLKDEKAKGNICFMTMGGEVATANLNKFIKSPTESILYDLNRDEVTAMTFISKGEFAQSRTWMNNLATAQVITELKQIIEERDKTIEELKCSD